MQMVPALGTKLFICIKLLSLRLKFLGECLGPNQSCDRNPLPPLATPCQIPHQG
jgi:hypothetical protein